MTRALMKLASASALALSLFAAPAMAQEAFEDWDADGSAVIEEEEFEAGFDEVGIYEEWDEDDDGLLSEEEFDAGVFNAYDADDSGVIEDPEWGDVGDDLDEEGFWDF